MFKYLLMVFSIFCGYLYINWLPVPEPPFSVVEFFLEIVFNPLIFVAAATAFIVGFILLGISVRKFISQLLHTPINIKVGIKLVIFTMTLLLSCIYLIKLGSFKAVLFFSFTILYGMMSKEI